MSYLINMQEIILQELSKMWWFTLLSIAVAALIKTYKLDLKLRNYLSGVNGIVGILLATALGLISPLCSCGILPIVISLGAAGVPLPMIMALLVASPIMSPDAYIITEAGLGTEFALLKLASAIFLGLFSGFMTAFLVKRGALDAHSFKLKASKKENGTMPTAYEIACANDITIPTMTVIPRDNKLIFFLERARDVGGFMLKMLALAIFLEALLLTFVPESIVVFLVGKGKFSSILLSAVVGLPLPVNQISVVPILAALLQMGMNKAAALTLLVAGPVSSFPAMITLYAIFDKKVFYNYIFVTLVGSIIIGYSYLLLFS